MTTSKTSETAAKKDVAKLQRAIVDGLEDVKAHDIQVFNTEHLTPLFERVIVASGTSNRQTKALAASVRDKVKESGFPKPRTEGEDNGEWIIVDCGSVVAHIMQPTIRQYYRLEDLWGEVPVRLKLGAAKPVAPEAKVPVKTAARRAAKEAEAVGAAPAKKSPARKPAAGRAGSAVVAAKKAPAKSVVKGAAKSAVKTTAQAAAKKSTKAPVKAAPIKTLVVKPRAVAVPAKKAAPVKRAAPAKTAASKAPARKAPGRKA